MDQTKEQPETENFKQVATYSQRPESSNVFPAVAFRLIVGIVEPSVNEEFLLRPPIDSK
jgi:hypothetical protein